MYMYIYVWVWGVLCVYIYVYASVGNRNVKDDSYGVVRESSQIRFSTWSNVSTGVFCGSSRCTNERAQLCWI